MEKNDERKNGFKKIFFNLGLEGGGEFYFNLFYILNLWGLKVLGLEGKWKCEIVILEGYRGKG